MSKLMDKRREKIIGIMKDYGYKRATGNYMISLYDLAYNLNNCWYAKYFVTKGNKKYLESSRKDVAFPSYSIFRMLIPIKSALGSGIILLHNGNGPYYVELCGSVEK